MFTQKGNFFTIFTRPSTFTLAPLVRGQGFLFISFLTHKFLSTHNSSLTSLLEAFKYPELSVVNRPQIENWMERPGVHSGLSLCGLDQSGYKPKETWTTCWLLKGVILKRELLNELVSRKVSFQAGGFSTVFFLPGNAPSFPLVPPNWLIL